VLPCTRIKGFSKSFCRKMSSGALTRSSNGQTKERPYRPPQTWLVHSLLLHLHSEEPGALWGGPASWAASPLWLAPTFLHFITCEVHRHKGFPASIVQRTILISTRPCVSAFAIKTNVKTRISVPLKFN
jgi:hypothetical protein